MEKTSTRDPEPATAQNLPSIAARRRSLYWRIHFWAALIASPFALVAALTGLLYVFTPQIEAALYARLDTVTPSHATVPLDDAVTAAQTEMGEGWKLVSVRAPAVPGASMQIVFAPEVQTAGMHDGHSHHEAAARVPAKPATVPAMTVYVNPCNAQVLGRLANQDRFNNWTKDLHSRLLQGDGWRWMIELAASWLVVMLVTGIYLWWPGKERRLLPGGGAQGRAAWRQWHAFAGVGLALISLVILLTGITWSKYAGQQVRALRDLAGQASPQAPADLRSREPQAGRVQLSWQAALNAARVIAPGVALHMSAPKVAEGSWRILAANIEQPAGRIDIILDAYTGKPLYVSGWDRQTAFGKATAVGIPFHRGELGWWNQLLLTLVGAGIIFSIVSGWMMVFKRSNSGAFGLPKLLKGSWRSAGAGNVVLAAGLCALMPLLAISALAIGAVEWWLHRNATQSQAQALP